MRVVIAFKYKYYTILKPKIKEIIEYPCYCYFVFKWINFNAH